MLTLKAAGGKDGPARSTLGASMAKLAAWEAAHRATDKAMQIVASAGYRRGSIVERLFRDVGATEIYHGSSEPQRMIITPQLLARALGWMCLVSCHVKILVATRRRHM